MPNEQFTLLEATPQTIANLNRLKSISPHLNLGATELSKGNNGGISFPVESGDTISGAFDVQLAYQEENGSVVPYVHVFDSSNPNSPYAGYVYSGSSSIHMPTALLTPSAGVVYIDIDYENETQTIAIASSLPSLTSLDRRWVYALAEVTLSNGIYSVHRMQTPGNLQVSGRWV
jgi:hypothetical protein